MRSRCRTGLVLATLTLAALPCERVTGQQPTVADVIARNIEARGGAAALAALTTMRVSGTVEAGGQKLPVTLTRKRPNRLCQEIEVQGTIVRSVFDGTRAWTVNAMLGSSDARELDGFPAEALRDQAAFGWPLAGYQAGGGTLTLEGREESSGGPAWKLKLTQSNGHVLYIVVDARTGLETKVTATYDQDGQPLVMETLLSDYAPVSGIQIAHTRRTVIGGQRQGVLELTSVEFNVDVDDALFTMKTGR